MDHFLYRDGALHAEDVPVADIAAAVGTRRAATLFQGNYPLCDSTLPSSAAVSPLATLQSFIHDFRTNRNAGRKTLDNGGQLRTVGFTRCGVPKCCH